MVGTQYQRIQVTVDEELAAALLRADPHPSSSSRLVRDLAIRGAAALEQERADASDAAALLLRIADGDTAYDFGGVAELAATRGDRLP